MNINTLLLIILFLTIIIVYSFFTMKERITPPLQPLQPLQPLGLRIQIPNYVMTPSVNMVIGKHCPLSVPWKSPASQVGVFL